MMRSEKVQSREKWVRRKASELGLIVRKSRSDGSWIVIDPHARPMATLVAGHQEASGKAGWPLEWVEGYLGHAIRMEAREAAGPSRGGGRPKTVHQEETPELQEVR